MRDTQVQKIRKFLTQKRHSLEMNRRNIKIAGKMASLVTLGRRTVRELDYNSRQAVIMQYRTLLDIIRRNKDTEYGRKYGFADIRNYDEYKAKVPLSVYDEYAPYIQRMMEGEENLLTACPPAHFAITSGSVGVPRYIPVSQEELDKYTKYSATIAFGVADEYYRNTTGRGVPVGPGLNAIEWKAAQTQSGVGKSVISATLMSSMKEFVPWLLSSSWEIICPEGEMDMKYLKTRLALGYRNLAFMDSAFMTGLVDLMDYIRYNYKMLCQDIYHGRINKYVKVPDSVRAALEGKLLPDPNRAKELMREFNEGFDTPIIPRIWPRMSWIGGIGTGGFFPYVRKMRKYSGKSIPFNNVCYAASESFIAASRHMGDESFVLIPDGGFYEFIPVRGDDSSRLLTIEELEVGEDYEIVITNLSGFYRYCIRDVVRVTGFYNECPMLRFIYRRDQLISVAGEKTNEEALRWAINEFAYEMGVYITDFSVYADTDSSPGHYVVLLEPEQIVPKQNLQRCRDVLEDKLRQSNPAYAQLALKGEIGPLEIIFLQQQTYQFYRDMMIRKGASANQLKPVRVIDTPMKKDFFFSLKEWYD